MHEHGATLTQALSLSETLRGRGSRYVPSPPPRGREQGEGAHTTQRARSWIERARTGAGGAGVGREQRQGGERASGRRSRGRRREDGRKPFARRRARWRGGRGRSPRGLP